MIVRAGDQTISTSREDTGPVAHSPTDGETHSPHRIDTAVGHEQRLCMSM